MSDADVGSERLLRVTGLGHSVQVTLPSKSTVGHLMELIQEKTGIPTEYQKLLARGSKLDDSSLTLTDVGLMDRTKVMLMHNALFAKERDGYETLAELEKEIDDLSSKKATMTEKVLSELVTRLCCKLDEVSVQGSTNLRNRRKNLLQKAESLDAKTKTSEHSTGAT